MTKAKQTEALVFTGLMAMASSDTSEIKGIRSRLQRAGLYLVTWDEISMKEDSNDDPMKTPSVSLMFKGIIDSYESLDKGDDDDDTSTVDVTGKGFVQFARIYMDDVAEAIGLLKGTYERAALPTTGVLGGVEGVSGWLDGIAGVRVGVRVRHVTTRDGDKRAYYDWLSPKELRTAGIDWDELQRPAYLPDGSEMEDPYAKPTRNAR